MGRTTSAVTPSTLTVRGGYQAKAHFKAGDMDSSPSHLSRTVDSLGLVSVDLALLRPLQPLPACEDKRDKKGNHTKKSRDRTRDSTKSPSLSQVRAEKGASSRRGTVKRTSPTRFRHGSWRIQEIHSDVRKVQSRSSFLGRVRPPPLPPPVAGLSSRPSDWTLGRFLDFTPLDPRSIIIIRE